MSLDRFAPPTRQDETYLCEGCEQPKHFSELNPNGFCSSCEQLQEEREDENERED